MKDQRRLQPTRRRDRPAQARSNGLVSALFYCALALVMIIVAVGTFLVVAAPVDIVRDQLASQVKARTGRDLTIAGRSSLSFYPSLGLSFSDVTLSPPAGLAAPPTLKIASLDVSVAIWPLLSRRIEVRRLTLHQPTVNLHIDGDGRRSWTFAAAPVRLAPVQLAQAARPTATTANDLPKELDDFVRGSTRQGGSSLLANLSAGEVRIEQGTVNFTDARNGNADRATALDLRISYRGPGNPLTVAGQGIFRDEPIDLALDVASPERLIEGQASKVDLTAKARNAQIRFDGQWTPNPAQADGNLDIDAANGSSLARLLRRPALASIATPIKLAGLVKASDGAVAFTNARLELERTSASGSLSVEGLNARPYLRANLRLTELDLVRLKGMLARPAALPTPAPAARANAPPRGIGDLIERSGAATPPSGASAPATKVHGFLKRGDWSDEPIDLSSLGLFDGEAKLAASQVQLENAKLGPTQATVTLRSGVLRASFDDVQLYEGRARGIAVIDISGRTPAFSLNLNADAIAVQPFLRDLIDNDRVSGRGRLMLAVAGSGATERRVMMSLEGKGELSVTNGAVAGLDAMQQVLGILQGRQGGTSTKTEFSEASASVVISAGVARNSDLKLIATGLRIGGAGDVDIGQRRIDYVFRPRADGMTVEVPVRARGPWDDVRYAAEMNREKAMEALKELGRQFNGQNVGEIIRGLTQPGENGEPPKARQLLERFLQR